MEKSYGHMQLTATEMGKLWATYMGNTMSQCVLSHYFQHVEDPDIKKVLDHALYLNQSILKNIKEIFIAEHFPVPIGFTKEDVNVDAPRLFSDQFYLHYLRYLSKAGMSIYSIAVPLMTRKDIRGFFTHTLEATVQLINEVDQVLMAKGFLTKPPIIPIPSQVDFVKKQSYLKGFFGNTRPLHALEITHLYENMENNVTSKALLLAFSQVAQDDQVRQFFVRGKELTDKQLETCSEKLYNENLPSPSSLEHLVSASTISPFSDKLMLAHKIDMFSMKIRTYGNGASLNGRRDIGAMYTKFLADIGFYVEDAANIMIDYGWMEQPPQAVNRDELTSS
ncbi:DUF3231 family protein [Bacillus sp. OTU530]|uniref:DUF3231 family protein n=1 Tax=Bacillus sp. OTU530 TaxID=3043862 RepID=UPI00313C50A5